MFVATAPLLLALDGETVAVPWRTFGHFSGPLVQGPWPAEVVLPHTPTVRLRRLRLLPIPRRKVASLRSL
ncbi:MAG: hypothetical protein LLG14_17660 [Nocardiaceae bacterium]|nr:hypothetical protein [Nocardiaceae bacterium]